MRSCKPCIFFCRCEDLDGKERPACRLHPLRVPQDMEVEGQSWDVFLVDDCGCAKGRPKNATCAECDHSHPFALPGGLVSSQYVECRLNPPTWLEGDFRYPFVKVAATCSRWQNVEYEGGSDE